MKDHVGSSTSIWADTATTESGAVLGSDTRAEVCVIGAGIAGLTTAYLLAKEGREVVLLDQDRPGSGQTARTTAHLSDAIDDRIFEIERIFGEEGARYAVDAHRSAISLIERIGREERIDSDFQRVEGYLFCGPDQATDILERELVAAHRAGLADVQLLARAPLSNFETGPCLRFPRQGRIHPLRYLDGLTHAFLENRGRFYTRSHVIGVESDGTDAVISTKNGPSVRAQSVVVATNSPITNRVVTHTKMHPYLTYAIGMRVERGTVPDALFWDTADPYHYVRLHREGQTEYLIIGGEDHWLGEGRDFEDRYERLELWARERFAVRGSTVFRWSGEVLETVDGLAFIGRNPFDRENVFIATGDSGMGMTHGTIAGRLLCDLIQGRETPWAKVFDPARKPLHSLGRYVVENLYMASHYADHFTAGDAKSVDAIPRGSGAVIRRGLRKVAAYRDENGVVHECHAVCPHLGGVVRWNAGEKTWDCPLHGSRFSATGRSIQGPAVADLAREKAGPERRSA